MKRIISLAAVTAMLCSFAVNSGAVAIEYGGYEGVSEGVIRYVSQIPSNNSFHDSYWGDYKPYASHECGTACISMALSYIGVDAEPLALGEYWISKGYTAGVPFSTTFYDVPGATGGYTNDFEMAMNRYESGAYSPVIIYLTVGLNPYRTGNRHFIMVVGRNGDGSYVTVDPVTCKFGKIDIAKNSDGSLSVTVYIGDDGERISGIMSEAQLGSAQYIADGQIEGISFPDSAESATSFVTPCGDYASATEMDSKAVTLSFNDSGCDSYYIYLRRAEAPGRSAVIDDGKNAEGPLFCTVGDGYTVRDNGVITFTPPLMLRKDYLYRFYVIAASGAKSAVPTYGFTSK